MRRLIPVMTGLAIMLATGAQAQQSVSPPSQDSVSGDLAPASPPAPAANAPVASAAPAAGAQAPIQEMGPTQEVAQAAPAPAQSYPPCSRNMKDSCRNPDPKKELPYYRESDKPS